MKEKKVTLKLSDLSSIVSFEDWIKKTTKDYGDSLRDRVPREDLKIYLNYILGQLDQTIGKNKAEWKAEINTLLKRLDNVKNK
jgi:hypothetical protein